jgi:ribonucleoside-triphosphate reductase
MAPGIRKTYKKRYLANLIKVMSILKPEVEEDTVRKIVNRIEKEFNLVPAIDKDEYEQVQRQVLSSFCTPEEIDKIENFVKKEAWKETDRATYQAMESLIHNLNTMHSRAGAQVPFSSLNYGTDTSPEGRMVIRNLLLATEAGLGNGETPIFPIQIFKVKEGVTYNPEDPNYDLFRLACKVSAKRLFPNFSFLDAPFNKQYYKPGNYHTEVTYMGCRTRVIGNVDKTKEIVTGRGNLSFTSINLPRLGIKAEGNIDKFFEMLDEELDLVVGQLLDRFEIQCKKKVYNFPFLMGQKVWLDSDKLKYNDEVREVLRHGTLSVGFIGLAETLVALIGKHHGESAEAQELGLKIVSHMRKRLDEETEKHQLNFSLLATPAEGLAGRFVKIDRKLYGDIKGVTDREYYTNSFHVPVYYPISIVDKIKIEGKYHPLTNAGHITYVELDGDPAKNVDAFEQIIRVMKENNIGYGSINHPLDRDPVCGYSGIINDECPRCGRIEDQDHPHFERIRRITGYLVGTLDRFNDAKRSEVEDRVKHGQV